MLPEVSLYNIKLIIAYDGTDFLGWQKTSCGPSIEGTIEDLLKKILQEDIQLQAASRTDAGVHAEGQVAHFFTRKFFNLSILQRSLNALLPSTIRIISIKNMELSFHPALDALSKEYHYHIYFGKILPPKDRFRYWHIHAPLSLECMQKAIPHFLGNKDFSAFCNVHNQDKSDKKAHVLDIAIRPDSDESLTIIVRGERFLYKMVRNIVGTLVFVGKGKISSDSISEILLQKDRTKAAMTAPALGLTLKEIFYESKH